MKIPSKEIKGAMPSTQNDHVIDKKIQLEEFWSPIEWEKEIESCREWLGRWSWSLGIGATIFSVLLTYYYSMFEHVSLSVFNSSVVSAQPIILTLIVFSIIVLALAMLLPIGILFTPLKKNEPILYELFSSRKNNSVFFRKKTLIALWIIGPVALTASILIVISQEWVREARAFIGIFLFVLLLIYVAMMISVINFRGISFKNISLDFWMIFIFSIFSQLFCITIGSLIGMRVAESFGMISLCSVGMVVIIIVFCISVFQIIIAMTYANSREEGRSLWIVVRNVLGVLLILAIYPPVGSKLAMIAFEATESGGRSCVVLEWFHPESINASLVEKDESEKRRPLSKPLQVLPDVGDMYQVRLRGESDRVWFVPHSDVSGMMSCPPSNGGKVESQKKS